MRHPGDVSDFDEYRRHLPEQWCPMVTIIGSVPSRNDETLTLRNPAASPSQRPSTTPQGLLRFRSQLPVSWKIPSVGKELRSPRRELFSVSPPRSLAAQRTRAIWPSASSTWPTCRDLPPPHPRRRRPQTTPSKRSARSDGRAAPSTPSKRPRVSEPANKPATQCDGHITPPETTLCALDQLHAEGITDSSSVPAFLYRLLLTLMKPLSPQSFPRPPIVELGRIATVIFQGNMQTRSRQR